MARKRKQLPETPEPASIESLSHDGRGIEIGRAHV